MIKAGYDPAPPAWLLEESIQEMGLSITAAAEKLGISRKHLSNIIHERAGITPSVALAIEQHIGGKAEVWLGVQNAYDLWKLRQSQIIKNDTPTTGSYVPTQTQNANSVSV
jgi:addiction module HigA family antidote